MNPSRQFDNGAIGPFSIISSFRVNFVDDGSFSFTIISGASLSRARLHSSETKRFSTVIRDRLGDPACVMSA